MKFNELKGCFLLVTTALIWGVAFVSQKNGGDVLGACTFNGIRNIIGGLVLIPCIAFLDWRSGKKISLWGEGGAESKGSLIKGGLAFGIVLGIAGTLQQIGIGETYVGKAGFITTLYIIFVPFCGLALGKKIRLILWICAFLAIYGMYLLCFKGDGSPLNRGDVIVFISSLAFSVHIMVIDYFATKADGVRMSCIQFFTAGAISLAWAALFSSEARPTCQQLLDAKIPLLYSGVMACGVGYTFQIIGQKSVPPVLASFLMSLESVFAALAGWALLHDRLSLREIMGCFIIFIAITLAQLPEKSKGQC